MKVTSQLKDLGGHPVSLAIDPELPRQVISVVRGVRDFSSFGKMGW